MKVTLEEALSTLSVTRDADERTIKQSFRRLALEVWAAFSSVFARKLIFSSSQFHPDRDQTEGATERFQHLSTDILSLRFEPLNALL